MTLGFNGDFGSWLARQCLGLHLPRGRAPPGPTCNGSELMAEFMQVWCQPNKLAGSTANGPTPTPAATSCSGGATIQNTVVRATPS